MAKVIPASRICFSAALAACLIVPLVAAEQQAALSSPAGSSASTSGSKAKELIELLQQRKLDAIAASDPSQTGRFVAALHIPNVQLLVVSAMYGKPSDIEARLYHKDYMGTYVDLNTSVHSSEKAFIEDSLCDGLVARPGKKALLHDSLTFGGEQQTFNGDFDAKGRNGKKISEELYFKAYTEADGRYTRLLDLLIAQLKKG